MTMKFLSLVIPCYNEEKNLPLLIDRCKKAFEGHEDKLEVILVDNGSTDNTEKVLQDLLKDSNLIRSVKVEKNQGYGYGIIYGLDKAEGQILAWTHADMQTDPKDILKAFQYFSPNQENQNIFLKGKRLNRPFFDAFFTFGMSVFETLLFGKLCCDINAQPNIFSKEFFKSWHNPPYDFSLDLYAYLTAHKLGYNIRRFPVNFGKRAFGNSHWNINFRAKIKFILRTLKYSLELRRSM